MPLTRSLNPIAGSTMDPSPLLAARDDLGRLRFGSRHPSLRDAAWFLWRASTRRLMREPSMVVRDTAAEQLEDRQSNWAYSKPVVFLDILWNLAFVTVAAGVLVASRDERPILPLRLWSGGHAVQCAAHMVCVCFEYQRRWRRGWSERGTGGELGAELTQGSGGRWWRI